MFVAQPKEKIQITAIYTNWKTFKSSFGYNQIIYIHSFKDEAGNCITWKTSNDVIVDLIKPNGNKITRPASKGSIIKITATVKGNDNYKGTDITTIIRPKFELIEDGAKIEQQNMLKVQEEKQQRKQAQLESIGENDLVWVMSYKRYKEHYADCETIIDSFDAGVDEKGHYKYPASIKVIIRDGRLKPSGVRGQRITEHNLVNEKNERITIRAVCISNAIKRANKEYPNHIWEEDED